MTDRRLLVPVAESATLRQTVSYVVETVMDADTAVIRFVYVHPPVGTVDKPAAEQREPAEDLLSTIELWATEDLDEAAQADHVTVETGHIGLETYLFSPGDVARAIQREFVSRDFDHVVLDPEYDPGVGMPLLRPLEQELSALDIPVEEPPHRTTRRAPLVGRTTPLRIGALFGLSVIFYQALAGTLAPFDLVTGAISGTVVAVALARVSFGTDPSMRSLRRLGRMVLYTPYLLWEIIKSNVLVAAIILRPRLSIEPRLIEYRPAVLGSVPITTLANSITLTPGTLTVRVIGRTMIIHALVPWAREGILDGGLEHAVRYVFYGRDATEIESPGERDDATVIEPAERGDEQ